MKYLTKPLRVLLKKGYQKKISLERSKITDESCLNWRSRLQNCQLHDGDFAEKKTKPRFSKFVEIFIYFRNIKIQPTSVFLSNSLINI